MTDLPDRLRRWAAVEAELGYKPAALLREVADELERQAAESLEVDHANRDLAARLAVVQDAVDQITYVEVTPEDAYNAAVEMQHQAHVAALSWRAALEADQQPAPPTTEPGE
jgi:peroxiredoxin